LNNQDTTHKKTSVIWALIPIIFLVGLLVANVKLFDDALGGANQLTLLLSAAVAGLVGWKLGFSWKTMLAGITHAIHSALPAILILLLIGSLAGTWLLSGVIPTMIYYGLDVLNASFFLVAACFISAIVSLATGSSWSTVATIGVALLGIGKALGFGDGIIAGAIISGAYFGDKMSPLSDTTNLAPAMAGTDLFTHIRYMMYTTVPTISITLIIFLVIGLNYDTGNSIVDINNIQKAISEKFYVTPWLFLIPAVVIFLIVKKVEAIPALLIGVLAGGVFAFVFQPHLIDEVSNRHHFEVTHGYGSQVEIQWESTTENTATLPFSQGSEMVKINGNDYIINFENDKPLNPTITKLGDAPDIVVNRQSKNIFESGYIALVNAATGEQSFSTSNESINKLLSSKGMYGMLNTIWLIICAMCFGGIMEVTGLLELLTSRIISWAKTRGQLIASTALTCIGFNLTTSDQYLSIVVPGRMFAKVYKDRGLAPENLSRTLEDSGTVTSVLIPWNTCGNAQSSVLGVATGDYFMYCFFNILSPITTVVFGFIGLKIKYLNSGNKID
jgi:Na+:H+ antiporter, NhaC family